jgi:glycosyltransferase involved in cell wall biosynthesis
VWTGVKNMKIMMLTCADSIHSVRWANAFVEKGHEVILVANKGHEEKADKLDSRVKTYYLPYCGAKGYYLNVHSLRKIWRKERPNVINVHYASGYGTLCRLAEIGPVILSVWGSDVYSFPKKSIFHKRLIIKNLNYADHIASTSKSMALQVRKLLNDEFREITVTPFGVDVNKFSPNGCRMDLGKGRFIIGIAKKLTYNYGIDVLIQAFKLFLEWWNQFGDVDKKPYLVICGEGPDKNEFVKMASDIGVDDSTRFVGYVPNGDLPAYLRAMDVVCLPSLNESFGVSAIEAMACGVPTITSDADGFVEVIDNKSTGCIVPKGDAVILSQALIKIYEDNDLRVCLGKNARDHVLAEYSWSSNVIMLENLLQSAIESKKG